jgi:hypothetical protein
VAYTKKKQATASPLQTLTAAALVLPGLMMAPAHAGVEEDSVDFQYSHYQEGKRDIYSVGDGTSDPVTGWQGFNSVGKQPNRVNPIEVDSLHGSSRFSLTDRVKFAFNYTQDTWSGATPVGTAPAIAGANGKVVAGASPYGKSPSNFFMDGKGNIYSALSNYLMDVPPAIGTKQNQFTHVLSYASPETRQQGDFSLSYDWAEAAVNVGGGLSVENDYESRFVNLGGRMDFNQKQTTVNAGLSYTNSDTFAKLDPDALPYISTEGYDEAYYDATTYALLGYRPVANAPAQIVSVLGKANGGRDQAMLYGKRQDWGSQLGLTQVLNKNAVLELGMGYTRSTGYMANPYKLVYVFSGALEVGQDPNQPILYQSGQGRLEKRPEERNQFNWNLGYKQYLPPFDAALHVDYHFAHDDWGINAHTFEADWVQPLGSGWSVTPNVRYYSQSGADFYTPFLTIVGTGYDTPVRDANGNPILDGDGNPTTMHVDTTKKLPDYYSSDQRLSGFGALSGGLTVAKQFAKGISLQTGFEYYIHQGSLKIGGGGEQGFANYDYWVANAALKINLESIGALGGHTGHSDRHHHADYAPAGIMFDHALEKSGDFMVGYRFIHNEQAGEMLYGSNATSPNTVLLNGCGKQECMVSPNHMTMNMHMLDLMVAPTNWLSLMLMPQWMDMEMDMTMLDGFTGNSMGGMHGGAVPNHQTGGIGDTGLYALFKLFERPGQHINLSLGGTAPTGDVNIKLRKTQATTLASPDVPIHYGMQLGSGTWDFKPSLTYTGEREQFIWGAQVTGTKRLESRNESNYALGDIFQSSVWGGYQWSNWLSSTIRGVYTAQGAIRGEYLPVVHPYNPSALLTLDHIGPSDKPANYGGQFVDLGLGVNVTIPSGTFAGNTIKFEWLQPIHTNYNGYQLDRDYSLAVTWGVGF